MSSEKRKTILLVEDEAILALSGKITLGKIGYNILIANTGEKAVKMIETMSSENPIDLILMDIDLGAGISGPEAAVQILKDRTIPIVFHTSHAEREMVETVRGITRYGYVIKNSGDFVLQSSIEMAFELFDSHKQLLNELKERQQAQDALKKSEEKFYKAFEASPNAIAISSLDTGIYIDVNEAFLTMTGYKKDEIIGHTSTEIEIWADITEREKFINKLVQDGYLRNFEASYRMKNKEVKDFLVSSETIELEGKHCGINFILDITESKQAEIKLRNAAVETQRLRTALDYVSAHIYMKDSKFRYIYANQSTLELFGCSAGELINCDDSCFFPPETVAQLRKIDARVLQGEQTTEEIVVKDDSGKQQIFWEIKTPIYADAQNKTILGLLGISTDITSRKKVEEDLIESKKQYENLVSKIPVGIYIFHTKPDGSFLFDYISPGIAALFNTSVDSFFADVRLIFKLVHPDDLESFVKLNNEGLELLRPFDWKGRILANGTVKWVHFTSTPELQENGDVLWHGLVVDISESKIAEEKINTLLKEKELLLKEVHHRIKNNMNTINSLFTLQADTLKDQAAIDALQDAASRVRSMMMLYDKLYKSANFNKILIMNYLSDLVDEIVFNFPNSSSVKIVKNIDDFVIDVRTIQTLGMIVNELITNIMKYAFTGREGGQIYVSAKLYGKQVSFVVQDNGNGMPEDIDFESSTGFGLMLVRILTDQLKGIVRIERGNGTKIALEFEI